MVLENQSEQLNNFKTPKITESLKNQESESNTNTNVDDWDALFGGSSQPAKPNKTRKKTKKKTVVKKKTENTFDIDNLDTWDLD